MAETTLTWKPCSAWKGIASEGNFGVADAKGISIELLENLGFATLIASPSFELSQKLESLLSGPLPDRPQIVSGESHDAIWSGPGQWLLRAKSRRDFATLLSELSEHASISEQSDGRAILRLSGPRVRDVLAKGVMIDLHPQAFAIGDAAVTSVAHIGVQFWRLPDGPNGAVFEFSVPRSMAGSFWSWLTASAAEYGYAVSSKRS